MTATWKTPLLLLLSLATTTEALDGAASSDCPALVWDETTDIGRVYRLTEACAALFSCPAGFYCAAGAYITDSGIEDATDFFLQTWSTDTRRCHAERGFAADTFYYACECGYGFWCAQDTALPRFCPKEYYCRTPATINECRAGHYCKEGSVFGRRCTVFEDCDGGSPRPEGSGGAVVVFLVLIFLSFVGFKLYEAFKESYLAKVNQEMEEYLESLRATTAEKTVDDDDDDDDRKESEMVEVTSSDSKKKKKKEEGFHIEFRDVRLTLPNGVTIMRGPSGEFKSGRSCAIMGASGAGKTTILNIVTGKVKKTSGEILVNGEPCDSLEKWKSRVAFVPQEDVMHRRLTVLQNVTFSAYLRLPCNLDDATKHAKVNKTLVSLNLDKIKHSIIGDEFKRGISGGQRKRVNVALELVADPKVCFLDEPTSGLDSVSATELCQMLRKLAETDSLTIAAVIHSPGPAAFAAFHDFLLLQTGGRPVYAGPMPEVRAYFASIGFSYDDDESLDPFADYVMKAVAGTHQPDLDAATFKLQIGDDHDHDGEWDHLTAFHKLWHLKIGKPLPDDDDDLAHVLPKSDLRKRLHRFGHLVVQVLHDGFVDYPRRIFLQLCPAGSDDPARPLPNSCEIFALCFKRAAKQNYVTFSSFLLSSIVVFFAIGSFVAAISSSNLNVLGGYPDDICARQYPGLRGRCRDLQQNSYVGALQFVGFVVVIANAAVAASTFGTEQPIYWREASTNLNTPAYFFAKVLADAPVCVVHALAASAGFASGFVSPMTFRELYAGVLLVTAFGYLSGYFLSFVLPFSATGLAGVGWAVFWALLYGGTTTLMSDNRETRWVWALSPTRWANEAWFDAATAYPYEKVRQGSEKGEDLFSMSRTKQNYLFFLPFHDAIAYGWLCNLVLLCIDLFLISATKLDKKR